MNSALFSLAFDVLLPLFLLDLVDAIFPGPWQLWNSTQPWNHRWVRKGIQPGEGLRVELQVGQDPLPQESAHMVCFCFSQESIWCLILASFQSLSQVGNDAQQDSCRILPMSSVPVSWVSAPSQGCCLKCQVPVLPPHQGPS